MARPWRPVTRRRERPSAHDRRARDASPRRRRHPDDDTAWRPCRTPRRARCSCSRPPRTRSSCGTCGRSSRWPRSSTSAGRRPASSLPARAEPADPQPGTPGRLRPAAPLHPPRRADPGRRGAAGPGPPAAGRPRRRGVRHPSVGGDLERRLAAVWEPINDLTAAEPRPAGAAGRRASSCTGSSRRRPGPRCAR